MQTLARLYNTHIHLLDLLGSYVRHNGEVYKVNGVDLTNGVLTIKKFQGHEIIETASENVCLVKG